MHQTTSFEPLSSQIGPEMGPVGLMMKQEKRKRKKQVTKPKQSSTMQVAAPSFNLSLLNLVSS